MKKYKKYTDKELAEAHVYQSRRSTEERKKAEEDFSKFRMERLRNMTEEERTLSRVLQLKFIMEDYIESREYNEEYTFGYFLNEYLYALKKKKTEFAGEIGLHNAQLSRLLNGKEDPSEKILVRLEIHSGNRLPAIHWYRVLEKQKEIRLMNDKELRKSELKKVKGSLKPAAA